MKKQLLSCLILCFSASVFAADQVIKEDTTPLAAEGALTPDKLQPLFVAVNQNPTQVQPEKNK